MSANYKYAYLLLLLINRCMVESFSRSPAIRFQGLCLTFIHLHTTGVRSYLYSSSIGNTAADLRQWEQWQIGQGNFESSKKTSLEEWLNGTFYEQYWESQLPEIVQSSADENENHQTMLVINGHDFFGRMAIYKFLIQEWEEKYNDASLVQLWGSQLHEGHWLWAYAAQLDWQQRSLRLSDVLQNDTRDEAIISNRNIVSSSWWGYMNFCFSVAVLIGAINASDLGTINCCLELDQESETLLREDLACQECVHVWQQLFSNVYPAYREKVRSALSEGEGNDDELQLIRFQFQREIWNTHVRIIETAIKSSRSQNLLMLLPEPERKFGLGWARMVDVLAASTFPTDLITIVKDGTGFLPFNIITDEIAADWHKIDKFTDRRTFSEKCHQRAVKTTHRLADLDGKSFDLIVKFWRRVVRDAKASRNMPRLVNRLVHGSWQDKIIGFATILILFIRP